MWMAVFGPLPKPQWFTAGWKVGYVIAVRFTGAILGNVLMWSGTVLYPIYAPGERYWGISPIADQSTAGVLMMVEGTFLALGVLAWVFFEVAREGTEKQDLLDLARERGVELDEERAQRAVAAGHGALLEERLTAAGDDERGRRAVT
jgi:cytochrome c oxidase assembly factor CtaG